MQNIVIACEDAFGIEVYSIICEINKRRKKADGEIAYNIIGFIDDGNLQSEQIKLPVPLIDTIDNWHPEVNERAVLGIAKPETKAKIVRVLSERGVQFESIIAPWVLTDVNKLKVGKGCIIWPHSLNDDFEAGDYVTLLACMIDSRKIGDYSTVLRFSNVAEAEIGQYSFVGNHAFLARGKKVGDNCYVADGSIIVNNVKDNTSVFGVPARRKNENIKDLKN